VIGEAATLTSEEIGERLDAFFAQKAAIEGTIVVLLGEVGRRESYRDEGSTSLQSWIVERFGLSGPTARAYTHAGEKAGQAPHLTESLRAGDISFDKFRTLADVATPEIDKKLRYQALEHSVRELAEVARTTAAARPAIRSGASEYDRRYLRFNDQCRTMTVQLPAESFAETKAFLDARVRDNPSDRETPLDQRRCDAFMEVIRSTTPGSTARATTASPFFVVAHVPLAALVGESGESTAFAAELEHDRLIDTETVQRIACDATVAVAVDDDVGHTMYEGRAQRFPTAAQRREVFRRDRHCRFPGCTNATFTNVHHIVPWKAGGRTDLENLVLMCQHHHYRLHSSGWSMRGNANEELTLIAPSGRVLTSRPSARWARVTAT
jgi:hypothetical protein